MLRKTLDPKTKDGEMSCRSNRKLCQQTKVVKLMEKFVVPWTFTENVLRQGDKNNR